MSQGHQQVPCSRRPGIRTAEGAESQPRVSKLLTTGEVAEIIRLSPETLAPLLFGAANISASSRLLHTPPSPLLQSNLPVEAFVNRVRIVAHAALENDLRFFDYRDVFREVAIE